MADNWYMEIAAYVEMMREVRQAAGAILEQNKRSRLLDARQEGQLSAMCAENDMLIRKMETRSFEVAVVGLENSGKSSVANALIGIPALPSASVRCTYTTTEICADDHDHARVEFYTAEEFSKRFRMMLGELGFAEEEQDDFNRLSLAEFNAGWEAICAKEPMKRRLYDSTTAEDVRTILGAVGLLTEFLGKPDLTFEGAETLLSAGFQSFITGQTDENDALKRDERPFAVKRVTIWSSQLQSMSNIVLYDVPGFNSPTLLHREQTRQMMDRADAIVMVTDMLANPNIDGTQLAILREADADRVQLKDKLFVFGNKADLLQDSKVFQDNFRTFVSDIVNRHRLTVERRVIVGSARAYFAAAHGDTEDEKRLEAFGCGTGIDRLRGMLTEYYDTERLTVLKNRAVAGNRAVIELLRPIAEHFAGRELEDIQASEFSQVIEAKDDIVMFRRMARQIVGRMYQDISVQKPFTRILRERIAQQIQPITAGDSLYQEILGSLNVQGDSANRNELVNANLRMNLQGYFNALIERMVWDIARHEELSLMEELTDALLDALSFDPAGLPDASEVEERARRLVMRMFDAEDEQGAVEGGTPFRARGFIALITRFVPGMTAAVIGYPLGSQGRMEEAIRISDELNRLSSADTGSDVDGMATLARILTHQDYFSQLMQRNRRALEEFFAHRKKLRLQMGSAEEERFMQRWASLAAQYDIDLTTQLGRTSALGRSLKLYGKDAATTYDALDAAFIEKLTDYMKLRTASRTQELAQAVSPEKKGLPTRTQVTESLIVSMARMAKPARTEQEVLEEINIDIAIYSDLLIDLLVPHLNLEKAFYERFINQINAMTGHSSVYDHKADALINEWLRTDIKRLKHKAFSGLEAKRREHESKQKLYETIAALIGVWQEKYARL